MWIVWDIEQKIQIICKTIFLLIMGNIFQENFVIERFEETV